MSPFWLLWFDKTYIGQMITVSSLNTAMGGTNTSAVPTDFVCFEKCVVKISVLLRYSKALKIWFASLGVVTVSATSHKAVPVTHRVYPYLTQ